MKNREMPGILKFLISLGVSVLVGWLGSLLIPPLQSPVTTFVANSVDDPLYRPMTIYILLALVPFLLSMLTGFGMAFLFRQRVARS